MTISSCLYLSQVPSHWKVAVDRAGLGVFTVGRGVGAELLRVDRSSVLFGRWATVSLRPLRSSPLVVAEPRAILLTLLPEVRCHLPPVGVV